MKITCDITQDLLPLYADGVCSSDSREAVEAHLSYCAKCRDILKLLKSESEENALARETDSVIMHQRKKQNRRAFTVGAVISGILLIPVLVCLIVNLAVAQALDWFFIVLASLALTASVTALPLFVYKHRFTVTVCAFTLTLMLLLMTVCIYVGGDWFFVAAAGSLFGLTAVCLPIVLADMPQIGALKRHKALICFAADTLMYGVLILFVGLYINADNRFWGIVLPLSAIFIPVAWAIFLLLRYCRLNGFIKGGILTVGLSAASFFSNFLINRLIVKFGFESRPEYESIQPFYPLTWNEATVNQNIQWLILISGLAVGMVLLIVGISRMLKRK